MRLHPVGSPRPWAARSRSVGGRGRPRGAARWNLLLVLPCRIEPGLRGGPEAHATPGTRCSGDRWAAGRRWKRRLLYADPRAILDTPRRRRLLPRAGRPAPPGPHAPSGSPGGSRRYRPRSILEVGCGYGKQLRAIRRRIDVPMVGIDFSPTQLGSGREYLDGLDRIALVLGSGAELPFPDRSFDLVLTSAVILHNPPDGGRADPPRGHPGRPSVRGAQRGHRRQLQPLRLRHRRLVSRGGAAAGRVGADPDRARASALPVLRGRAVATLTRTGAASPPRIQAEGRRLVRDSLIVTLGGQLDRALGTLTAAGAALGARPVAAGRLHGPAALPRQHEPLEPGGRPGGRAGDPDPPRRGPRGRGPARRRRRLHDQHPDVPASTPPRWSPGPGSVPRCWRGDPLARRMDLGPGGGRRPGADQAVRELPRRRPAGAPGIRA